MQAASLLDGFSFDLFPPFENGLAAPKVDVSRRQVVQALVVSTVVVVADELRMLSDLDALRLVPGNLPGIVLRGDAGFHSAHWAVPCHGETFADFDPRRFVLL
jgi:hypothetical protein